MWGKYEELRPDQIDAIRKETPVAYLPWGALEWHSYHAPVGLDGMKAHGLCCAMAEKAGGVVLPAIYIGTDTIKSLKGFKHTIEHGSETITTLAMEFLGQLADEGFKVIIILIGHYGGLQVESIERAVEMFRKAHPETKVWAFPDSEPLTGISQPNHAARGETALQMLFRKDLINLEKLPDRELSLDADGIWGEDPRLATAKEGRKLVEHFLSVAVPGIKKMLRESAE